MAELIQLNQSSNMQGANPFERSNIDNRDVYLLISSDQLIFDSDAADKAFLNQFSFQVSSLESGGRGRDFGGINDCGIRGDGPLGILILIGDLRREISLSINGIHSLRF